MAKARRKQTRSPHAVEMNPAAISKLQTASLKDIEGVFDLMESSKEGITQAETEERIAKFGLNEVEHERAPSWFQQLMKSFVNPFIAILFVIAVISFMIDVWWAAPGEKDFKTVIVIGAMILISAFLSFFQEYRSNRAAEQLKSMVKNTAAVQRKDGGRNEIEMSQIVPGDVVYLAAGDMIPADCRVVESIDLFISESMLTGESLPVEKMPSAITDAKNKRPLDLDNLCFMGTNVISGAATAVMIATGDDAEYINL